MKQIIIAYIHNLLLNGYKSNTELTAAIIEFCHDNQYTFPIDLLDSLVAEELLIEVEYIAPSANCRVKSLYFHPKTAIRIVSP